MIDGSGFFRGSRPTDARVSQHNIYEGFRDTSTRGPCPGGETKKDQTPALTERGPATGLGTLIIAEMRHAADPRGATPT